MIIRLLSCFFFPPLVSHFQKISRRETRKELDVGFCFPVSFTHTHISPEMILRTSVWNLVSNHLWKEYFRELTHQNVLWPYMSFIFHSFPIRNINAPNITVATIIFSCTTRYLCKHTAILTSFYYTYITINPHSSIEEKWNCSRLCAAAGATRRPAEKGKWSHSSADTSSLQPLQPLNPLSILTATEPSSQPQGPSVHQQEKSWRDHFPTQALKANGRRWFPTPRRQTLPPLLARSLAAKTLLQVFASGCCRIPQLRVKNPEKMIGRGRVSAKSLVRLTQSLLKPVVMV